MDGALFNDDPAGPGRLRAAVNGLGPETLVSRFVAGRWSVLEVVRHLSDIDANISLRLKRVQSEDRPVFDQVRPDLKQGALAYHGREVRGGTRNFRPRTQADRAHPSSLAAGSLGSGGNRR